MLDLSSVSLADSTRIAGSNGAEGSESDGARATAEAGVQGAFLSGDGSFELHEGTFTLADAAQGLAARSAAHAATVAELSRHRHPTLEPHAMLRNTGQRPAGVKGRGRQRRRSSGAERLASALGLGNMDYHGAAAATIIEQSTHGRSRAQVRRLAEAEGTNSQPVLSGMDFVAPRDSVMFAAARRRLGIRLHGEDHSSDENEDEEGEREALIGSGTGHKQIRFGRRAGAGTKTSTSAAHRNSLLSPLTAGPGRATPEVSATLPRQGDAWGLAGKQWAATATSRPSGSKPSRSARLRKGVDLGEEGEVPPGSGSGSQTARTRRVGL